MNFQSRHGRNRSRKAGGKSPAAVAYTNRTSGMSLSVTTGGETRKIDPNNLLARHYFAKLSMAVHSADRLVLIPEQEVEKVVDGLARGIEGHFDPEQSFRQAVDRACQPFAAMVQAQLAAHRVARNHRLKIRDSEAAVDQFLAEQTQVLSDRVNPLAPHIPIGELHEVASASHGVIEP